MLVSFFHERGDRASLHSFPTRRSSDLAADQVEVEARHDQRQHQQQQERREAVAVNGLQQQIDRKSTRLNSSHMSISYAVFCLKKKNERGHLATVTRVSSLLSPPNDVCP